MNGAVVRHDARSFLNSLHFEIPIQSSKLTKPFLIVLLELLCTCHEPNQVCRHPLPAECLQQFTDSAMRLIEVDDLLYDVGVFVVMSEPVLFTFIAVLAQSLKILNFVIAAPGNRNLVIEMQPNALARVSSAHLTASVLKNFGTDSPANSSLSFWKLRFHPDQLIAVIMTVDCALNHKERVEVPTSSLNLRVVSTAHPFSYLLLRERCASTLIKNPVDIARGATADQRPQFFAIRLWQIPGRHPAERYRASSLASNGLSWRPTSNCA